MGKRSAGRHGRAPMRAMTQTAPCAVSAPISCAEAGIPAAGAHGGQVLHVSAYNPLDEPVTGGTGVGHARSPAARSQNESGARIILRAGLRWRSWSMPCPRRLRLPHTWLAPLPRARQARHGCAHRSGEPCGTQIALSQTRDVPVGPAQRRTARRIGAAAGGAHADQAAAIRRASDEEWSAPLYDGHVDESPETTRLARPQASTAVHALCAQHQALAWVTVQVVKTGITPQLATSIRFQAAKMEPLHPAGRLHMRR